MRHSMLLAMLFSIPLLAMPAVAQFAAPSIGLGGGPEGAGAPVANAAAWSDAEFVFTGTLDQVVPGPVGMSMPPMRTYTLHFTLDKALRGDVKPGAKIACSQVLRQVNEPVFQIGKSYLVAANKPQDVLSVIRMELAAADNVKSAELACGVPLGWQLDADKALSPWASLGAKAWPADAGALGAKLVCKTTGRPALFAGSKADLAVEKVPPKTDIQWTNPDGDGEYTVTVSNPTDQPLAVPALLRQADKILWEESLVILCQGKTYLCPGATGISGKVESVTLKPGEKVSTVVNALRLNGPQWPGGDRIEFRFCLGEKSQTMSFYYMGRHHDPIRAAVQNPK
jgi:hypothetical protein